MDHGLRVDDIPLDALVIHEGDVLWFRATSKELGEIQAEKGVAMVYSKLGMDEAGLVAEIKTVEAIISRQSPLVGRTGKNS